MGRPLSLVSARPRQRPRSRRAALYVDGRRVNRPSSPSSSVDLCVVGDDGDRTPLIGPPVGERGLVGPPPLVRGLGGREHAEGGVGAVRVVLDPPVGDEWPGPRGWCEFESQVRAFDVAEPDGGRGVVATGRDSLRTVTTRSSPRSRENPASVPRAAPIAVCRIVPGSPLDQVFLGQHSTQPHGLDGLGPSEKRKVTGSTPVPTTTDDQSAPFGADRARRRTPSPELVEDVGHLLAEAP
jgi:hypothetical protein